nr:HAMP domain-containing sensor histidine kinase [uncultured Acetatifactor sp.]
MKDRQMTTSGDSEKHRQTGRQPKNRHTRGKAASRDISLRGFFMLTVFGTFCVVALLSGLVIAGCAAFRRYLLPDANAAYLTIEYTLEDGTQTSESHLLTFGEESKLPGIVTEAVGSVTVEDDVTVKARSEVTEGPDAARIETNEIMLDATYSIQKLELGYDTLTPKRKLAYQFCGAAMVIVPAVLSVGGILLCGFYFYKKRLALPIKLLSDATEEIAAQNLDFSLEYACGDEMGGLCRSFEAMRGQLAENNRTLWNMLEQRRLMQASIAHDLRNPIAIIEGYTEYLQMNLPAGKISPEKAERIAGNLNLAAKRLEQYTESVRELNQLEDMEIHREEIPVRKLVESIREDLEVMAAGAGIALHVTCALPESGLEQEGSPKARSNGGRPDAGGRWQNAAQKAVPKTRSDSSRPDEGSRRQETAQKTGPKAYRDRAGNADGNPEKTVKADIVILHRILENVFENATRFAQNTISVDFVLSGYMLQIAVTDDGDGFSDEILQKRKKAFLPTGEAGHLGMGLAVSRVLCEKHGGSLEIRNAAPHGGMVEINLSVI